MDMQITGNHSPSTRQEKAAIRKALNSGRFVLPVHDRPGVVEAGRVIGRTFDSCPGPMHANEDYPGPLTSAYEGANIKEMAAAAT
jgi:hypothetical protein